MIDIALLIAKQEEYNSVTMVGMNENSQNLVKKSLRKYQKVGVRDLELFNPGTKTDDLVNFEVS